MFTRFSIENFKTTSPQGDGNHVPTTLPHTVDKFQNHIPARGRKQTIPLRLRAGEKLFQNHIPVRGRKREALASPVRHGGGGPRSGGRGAMDDIAFLS